MVQELVDGGTFLLNCPWNMEELEQHLPGQVKKFIADHKIKFYTIDGVKGYRRDRYGSDPYQYHPSVCILQAGKYYSGGKAIELMKAAARQPTVVRGEDVVKKETGLLSMQALRTL